MTLPINGEKGTAVSLTTGDNGLMRTMLVVEITHRKPLPAPLDVTDVLMQRTYGGLHSQGCEAGVKVVLAGKVGGLGDA